MVWNSGGTLGPWQKEMSSEHCTTAQTVQVWI